MKTVYRLLLLLVLLSLLCFNGADSTLLTPSGACLNNGTPINSTACICPAYVDGQFCENVKCQRFSIPDKNRCACPPGWYDKYCGLRGCRPANEDNLDLSRRSFIIVFNTKKSMAKQLEVLRTRFIELIGSITKNAKTGQVDDWIENYIFYGFVQQNSNLTIQKLITNSPDEFLHFLKYVQLSDGDEKQPVLTALKNAQQTYPNMKSHAIVLVFSDSPASDATSWSHRFTDKNVEQSCLQISLLWRSKVSFILSLPDGTSPEADSVDVYRRLSLTNHGETFFVKNENETDEILQNVISTYYFPENLATGYGIVGNQTVEVVQDNSDDIVFVLITFDFNSKFDSDTQSPYLANGKINSRGSFYKLFTFTDDNTINIISMSKSKYNYRIFIQSKNTILIDYNDDMTIDVGNGMAVIGIGMSATMKIFGFDTVNMLNSSYHVLSANNSLIRENYYSSIRPQLDCTFEYGFKVWDTLTCPPGPITQFHSLHYNGFTKQRVTTGYCIQSDHNNDKTTEIEEESINLISDNTLLDTDDSCETNNLVLKNDPRLEGPKQFVFVLEQHSANKATFQMLAREIGEIVEFTRTGESIYRNEYTVISHCDKDSRILLSTYNPDIFIQKFSGLISSINFVDKLDNTMGLLSIVQAQKLNIQPTSQLYYFTNQAVKNVKNISRRWDIVDKNIEINFFTIADGVTTKVFSLPKQLELVQKMSNGRIIPLGSSETSIKSIFGDMMGMNALTTDSQKYDCHTSPLAVDAFVGDAAISTNIQIVGTGIQNISVLDSTGFSLNITSYLTFKNSNFATLKINNSTNPGMWKISVSTTQEGCQVTVRQNSKIRVLVGFTGDLTTNAIGSQIPSQRSDQNQSLYVPIQIFQSNEGDQVIPTSLRIENINPERYDLPEVFYTSNITEKNPGDTCSYAFRSTYRVPMPKSELSLFTLSGILNGSTAFVRKFYFYQHFPADPTICHGDKVDQYGQCICPSNYTGEYCWDRICSPGAISSYGMCSCQPGFYGDFCEIKLIIPNGNVSTTSATTIESTTKTSRRLNNFGILLLFLLFSKI